MAQILIIEDDPQLRDVLRQHMEYDGHHVFDAANGAHGLDTYNAQKIDLVITDIFMPDKEGIETIIELREKSQKVKIIAMSGGGRLESVDYLILAQNLGANRIFNKPFKWADMRLAINELLG
ncbi:MAG: response regulator [Proteobacteria bacterium]|nr:response regulator [Pseudomonadota bacterium]MBU1710849.1 response regulator [Pseudomonadota bacterium]